MSRPPDAGEPPVPREADSTRRQQLLALLAAGFTSFEALRRDLGGSLKRLEEDLRHVEKSLRSSGRSLEIEPARCGACGTVFHGRESRHFHPPGRCPRCRSKHIEEPRFRIRP